MKHFLYTPFTGLGLYGGFRGKRWLRNRIKVFKQFVVPSLNAQSSKNFTLWVSWRYEDRKNPLVQELGAWLSENLKVPFMFTYSGVCFWDDKYPDDVAHDRLIDALHGAMPSLSAEVGQNEEVLMTIQPSDDCYRSTMVDEVQKTFAAVPEIQAFVYKRGFITDYTKWYDVAEWNPVTSPPFYTIKFKKDTFLNPLPHIAYAGIKSHEYLPERLTTFVCDERGFLVGTHGENISTVYNHPFRGDTWGRPVLAQFGVYDVPPIKLPISLRKKILRKLPHNWQRKIRYIFGEKFAAKIYDFLRS